METGSVQGGQVFDYKNSPWFEVYGNVARDIEVPKSTMYEIIKKQAEEIGDHIAYHFMSTKSTYGEFLKNIDITAEALKEYGVKKGDKVIIALPNIPQALFAFYAINKIGAISVMVHPLSAGDEMAMYIKDTAPKAVITLNLLYKNFAQAIKDGNVETVILAKINDCLGFIEARAVDIAYFGKGKINDPEAKYVYWKDFFKEGLNKNCVYEGGVDYAATATILFSGGTSGFPKGICLSSSNFNALGTQLEAYIEDVLVPETDTMIAILPIFHGFGLGVCIHSMFLIGCRSILVPQFSADNFAKMIVKHRPNYIAGAPSMYEKLLRNDKMKNVDLSCLKGAFSGGDKLPQDIKDRFDDFLKERNSNITLLEGYGLTETVTASVLTPKGEYREGSVGVPLPGNYVKIVEPGTTNPVPVGTDGEICMRGPTTMLGYYNAPEENEKVMIYHPEDDCVWLHTGDMGNVDAQGFIYFKQRIKRIIKISGYNVYPSMIEEAVCKHPAVDLACAISVPDPLKISRIKLFVQISDKFEQSDELKEEIMKHCKESLNVWSVPKEIEFIDVMPTTRVGKVDFKTLQEMEDAKLKQDS